MKVARLAVAGVAITAGLIAYMLSGSEPAPQQSPVVVQKPAVETDWILVAKNDLQVGTPLKATDLAWAEWPRNAVSQVAIARSQEANAQQELTGAITRAPFFAGEPIRRDKIVKSANAGFLSAILPAGQRAVSINIDSSGASSAGGFILPNDRVDVLLTAATQDGAETTTVLSAVRVLAIGQNITEKDGEKVVTGSHATLDVTPAQATKLTLAQRQGQLSLVLRSMLDGTTKRSAEDEIDEELDRRLTVVRYGVSTR
ncbi:MAG TPA: Flp pilus assembly protein CpaB [Beijerinckiaceae bacterium]|jgi:pilus assembly protein CpaB